MNTNTHRFAPPKSDVADVIEDTGVPTPASRASRLGAATIDWLACLAIYLAIMLPLYGIEGLTGRASWRQTLPGLTAYLVLAYAMEGWFLYRSSQSLGKLAVGLRIIRSDGSHAGFARTFWLRLVGVGLLSLIPFLGMLLFLVDCLFIFGASRRCLHDHLADTIVVTVASSPA